MKTQSIDVIEAFQGGFEHAVVLTYNHDLSFFERVIRPILVAQGARNVLIVADEREHAATFQEPLQEIGLSYLVQPVLTPGAFHPKMLLLANRDRGRLLVGSGNLTVPGYTRNVEVFTAWDYDDARPDEAVRAVFAQAMAFLNGLARSYPFRSVVRERLALMREEVPWLGVPASPAGSPVLLHNLEMPLLDQVRSLLGGERIRRVVAMSPYFDDACAAVEAILRVLAPRRFELITSDAPRLRPAALQAVFRRSHTACSLSIAAPAEDAAIRYPHAKWLLVEGESRSWLLAGSANLTAPAWLKTATEGNVELMALVGDDGHSLDHLLDHEGFVLQPADFDTLRCLDPEAMRPQAAPSIRLVDAVLAPGRIRCLVDGAEEADPPVAVEMAENTVGLPLGRDGEGWWIAAAIPGTFALPAAVRVRTAGGRCSNAVWISDLVGLAAVLMPSAERAERDLIARFQVIPDEELLNLLVLLQRHLVLTQDPNQAPGRGAADRNVAARPEAETDALDYEDFVVQEDEVYQAHAALWRGYREGGILSEAMAGILRLITRTQGESGTAPGSLREERGASPVTVTGLASPPDKAEVGRKMQRFVGRFLEGAVEADFVAKTPSWVHCRNFRMLGELALYLEQKGYWDFHTWADQALDLVGGLLEALQQAPRRKEPDDRTEVEETLAVGAAYLSRMLGSLGTLGDGRPEVMAEWRFEIVNDLTRMNRLCPVDQLSESPTFAEAVAVLGSTPVEAAAHAVMTNCPQHSKRALFARITRSTGVPPRVVKSNRAVHLHWGAPLNLNDASPIKRFQFLALLLNTVDYEDYGIHGVYIRNEGGTNRRLHGIAVAYRAGGGVLAQIRAFTDGTYNVDWMERVNRGYFLRAVAAGDPLVFSVGVKFDQVPNRRASTPAAAVVRDCCIGLETWRELLEK